MVNSVAQAQFTGEQRGKLSPLGRTFVLQLGGEFPTRNRERTLVVGTTPSKVPLPM